LAGQSGYCRKLFVAFQTSIDFNKTPMDYYDESDAIIESYNISERDIPTLHRILGLMAKEHINKLRQMFSKDEILAFPSIDSSTINIGLIAI
jgi:hypothetical protein